MFSTEIALTQLESIPTIFDDKFVFSCTNEFFRDCKRLVRKQRSLPLDLYLLGSTICSEPPGDTSTKKWHILKRGKHFRIVKTRLFCRAAKGNDFRIVLAFYPETYCVDFIEVFAKNKHANEDTNRVTGYLLEHEAPHIERK